MIRYRPMMTTVRRCAAGAGVALLLTSGAAGVPEMFAAEWKVGLAKVSITPERPVHLLGYSNRSAPFERVESDIFAKALAIEDAAGNRGVIVTCDLVGVQDAYFAEVAERIEQRTGLARRQLLVN